MTQDRGSGERDRGEAMWETLLTLEAPGAASVPGGDRRADHDAQGTKLGELAQIAGTGGK